MSVVSSHESTMCVQKIKAHSPIRWFISLLQWAKKLKGKVNLVKCSAENGKTVSTLIFIVPKFNIHVSVVYREFNTDKQSAGLYSKDMN